MGATRQRRLSRTMAGNGPGHQTHAAAVVDECGAVNTHIRHGSICAACARAARELQRLAVVYPLLAPRVVYQLLLGSHIIDNPSPLACWRRLFESAGEFQRSICIHGTIWLAEGSDGLSRRVPRVPARRRRRRAAARRMSNLCAPSCFHYW
jgi:hypothetical protein